MRSTATSIRPVSIYIHWPYCIKKCPFCAFNKYTQPTTSPRNGGTEEWFRPLEDTFIRELRHSIALLPAATPVASVYFGGGTPSLCRPSFIERVLKSIQPSTDAEVTLEANPNERSKLGAFRAAGITRLSIGIQSLRDRTLRTLGRMHTRADGLATINEAHRVFGANAFSVDAMYGVPGLSVDEWREDISEMTSMAGGHLSIYQLSVERGTPFFDKYAGSLNKYARSGRNNSNSGGMNASSGGRLPSEDIVAAMDEATREATRASGHRRYEVSSYARPGCEAVHNGGTWLGRDYIAHGRFTLASGAVIRYVDEPVPEKWIQRWRDVDDHVASPAARSAALLPGARTVQTLTTSSLLQELAMLGLRHRFAGISERRLQEHVPSSRLEDVLVMEQVRMYAMDEDVEEGGLLLVEEGRGDRVVRCTERGLDLLDAIMPRVVRSTETETRDAK